MTARRGNPSAAFVVAVAAVLTVLNAVKPVHIDDVIPLYYANQIAEHPLAPYDFEVLWCQIPQPAQGPIAPPVFLYWLAAGQRLLGADPFLLKLWLFPINLALTASIASLARRFARGLEAPLLLITVLSPTVLPSLNLMFDVPNLAIGLLTLALFAHACDRDASGPALLAGLVCGLALETKWTSFALPGVLLMYALSRSRPRLWFLTTGVAVAMFVSWETYITLENGVSHFVFQLRNNNPTTEDKALLIPLLTYVGGTATAVTTLGLAALRAPRWTVRAAMVLTGLGFLVLLLVPNDVGQVLRNPLTGRPWKVRLDTPVHLALGLGVWSVMAAVVFRVARSAVGGRAGAWRRPSRRASLFLLAWLAIEIAGYFVFSPFGATRRVIHLVFVLTLIGGRLASRVCRSPERRGLVRTSAAFGLTLAAVYTLTDLAEASAAKRSAEVAARFVQSRAPGAVVWFSGVWGFEYHATRAGMRPALPDRSVLAPGDWLVVSETKGMEGNAYRIDESLELVEVLPFGDPLPLATVPCFYIGRRPIENQSGPRMRSLIYRVRSEFKPVRLPKVRVAE